MILNIYFDGGTKGNRVCVHNNGVFKIYQINCKQTNNQLEFTAIIFALRSISECYTEDGKLHVNIVGDSELVVGAFKPINAAGHKNIISPKLIHLYEQAIEEIKSIKNVDIHFCWVPRAENLAGIELDKK